MDYYKEHTYEEDPEWINKYLDENEEEHNQILLKEMEEEEEHIILQKPIKEIKPKFFYLEGTFCCGKTTLIEDNYNLTGYNGETIYIDTFKMDFVDVMKGENLNAMTREIQQLVYLNKSSMIWRGILNMAANNTMENMIYLLDRNGCVSSGLYLLIFEYMEIFLGEGGFENINKMYNKIDEYIQRIPKLNENDRMIIYINHIPIEILKNLVYGRGNSFELEMDENQICVYRYIQNYCFEKLYDHYISLGSTVYLHTITDLKDFENNKQWLDIFLKNMINDNKDNK